MAQKHHSALELADIQEALLQLAARRTSESQALSAEVLRLAAALINAAALPSYASPRKGNQPTSEALARWRDNCAELLAAIAPAADGLSPALNGNPPNTREDSLPARAAALATQNQITSEALSQECQSLREQITSLLREASRYGALERELQLKKARFADQVARTQAAEGALKALDAESAQTAVRIEELQQRLQLASRTPSEIARLEEEVRRTEGLHDILAKDLAELEEKHAILILQTQALPERIEKTECLISELRQMPEHVLIGQINEIWERVRRLHEGQA